MPDLPKKFRPFKDNGMRRIPRKNYHEKSRQERGYDRQWELLRDNYAAKNPLCESCLRKGYVEPMFDVDHIQPFRGLDDPLRLDPDNLQSLCRKCHTRKTAKQNTTT